MNEDALVKLGLETLLSPFVEIRTQHEVQPPTQFVDVFVASSATQPEVMGQTLGWLGRMASSPCLLEAFAHVVSEDEARDCLRKQLTLHHTLKLSANEPRSEGQAGVEVPFPTLWLLSWGRPTTLLMQWGMTPAPNWPTGFYQTPPGFHGRVVVLPELPRTRETLPLRLFGDERVRQGLREELARLPPSDPMGQTVRHMLFRWRLWLQGQPQDEATRRRLMDFEQLVQQETQRLRNDGEIEGKAKGKAEGKAQALLLVLKARGLEVSPSQQATILGCRQEAKLDQWLLGVHGLLC